MKIFTCVASLYPRTIATKNTLINMINLLYPSSAEVHFSQVQCAFGAHLFVWILFPSLGADR